MNYALITPNGRYRYELGRDLGVFGNGKVLFIMLNPSTADATQDDPTIRRCIGFAQQWGYSELLVGNLSPFRATDPEELKLEGPEPLNVHQMNRDAVVKMALASNLVVCAWGTRGNEWTRDYSLNNALSKAGVSTMCLGRTQKGHPRHPLYLSRDTPLQPYQSPPSH